MTSSRTRTRSPISNSSTISSGTDSDVAARIVARLLRGFSSSAGLRLWNDRYYHIGLGPPAFTLVLRDPGLLRQIMTAKSALFLADAYFRNQLDIEGDLYTALTLKTHFAKLHFSWREKMALLLETWRLSRSTETVGKLSFLIRLTKQFSKQHTPTSDQEAIAFHYDVSNDFYALWLDRERVYSCAYFNNADDTLDQAQQNKLDLVCRKLRLSPGEQLLDIGCGWGALICWAARHFGVRAHGITLSQAQHDYAQQRIIAEGLQDSVTVEIRDYRDLQGESVYDKVVSIGMFEHVGLANMAIYLGIVQRVLRPGGLFLNHGITHDEEGWNQTIDTDFINRYVFPDGELDCVSNIQLGMERAGFEIHDVEALRRHYALTLRHWVQRLEEHRDAAIHEVDESTYRIWRFYMAACALEFEAGGTGIYQILASRRGVQPLLPLTRQDIFAPSKTTEDRSNNQHGDERRNHQRLPMHV